MARIKDPVAQATKQQAKAERAQVKRQAREAQALQREEAARAQAQAAADSAFWASPQGQARAAFQAGHAFYQIDMPIRETKRTVLGVLSGDKTQVTTRQRTGQTDLLGAIESEGWKLEDVGYVFQETGSVSRDKFGSSGQTAAVMGEIIGIYLFRRTDEETDS